MATAKKILIVEDEESFLFAFKEKIQGEGFEVLEAKNGEKGLELALKEHPDLILLDILMPVMDGMTMLKKLREDEWGKKAQVILLTNLSDNEKTAQALELNTFDYLVKSDWNIKDVVVKIREKLK